MPGITPDVGEIVQIRALCNEPVMKQVGINVTHWKVVSRGGLGAQLPAMATSLDSSLAVAYKDWLGATSTYRGVGATNISGIRSLEFTTIANAGPGLNGVRTLPGQLSGLIQWKTLSAGRHYRGRIYPPFPNADWADANGELTPTGLVKLDNIRAAYGITRIVTTGGNSSTITLVVLHRPTLARPIPPNAESTNVDTGMAIGGFATQRRRSDFGRQNQPPF